MAKYNEKGIMITFRELPRFFLTGKVKTFGGSTKYKRRGTKRVQTRDLPGRMRGRYYITGDER